MSKKRRKKRRIGTGLIVIEVILGLIILAAVFVGFCYYFCMLKTVSVSGTDLYSSEEIQTYILDDEYSVNGMYVFLRNKIHPKKSFEFIDNFEVKLTGLDSIEIVAHPKAILGYMIQPDGSYIYFDFDGCISEISTRYIDGYLLVSGVTCDEPAVGQQLNIGEQEIGYLTVLIQLLTKYEMIPYVISYDDYGKITLVYDRLNILLGDNSYLEEKLLEYCIFCLK